MRPRKKYPPLTGEVVKDEVLLDEAINGILRGDRALRQHSARIIEAQEELRTNATVDAWAAYLSIEELSNARFSAALRIVATRAWTEGARAAAGRRR